MQMRSKFGFAAASPIGATTSWLLRLRENERDQPKRSTDGKQVARSLEPLEANQLTNALVE